METGCSPESPECACSCGCGCQDDPGGGDTPFVGAVCASCAIGNHETRDEDRRAIERAKGDR